MTRERFSRILELREILLSVFGMTGVRELISTKKKKTTHHHQQQQQQTAQAGNEWWNILSKSPQARKKPPQGTFTRQQER